MTEQLTLEQHKEIFPHRLTLKLLDRESAKLYLDKNLPDLDGPALEYALSLSGQHIYVKTVAKPQDPLFCAAMFLAGVSLGDLSLLFNIAKQTVAQKIARRLSPTQRKELRDRLQSLDLEVLALARRLFNDALAAEPSVWEDVHPLEVGRALLSSATAMVALDRGEEPAPSRPRRYSNMNISQPSGKEIAAELVGPLPEAGSDTTDSPDLTAPPSEPQTVPLIPVPSPSVVRADEQSFLDSL